MATILLSLIPYKFNSNNIFKHDLSLQNDFKHKKAAKCSREMMWLSNSMLSHLPLIFVFPSHAPHQNCIKENVAIYWWNYDWGECIHYDPLSKHQVHLVLLAKYRKVVQITYGSLKRFGLALSQHSIIKVTIETALT